MELPTHFAWGVVADICGYGDGFQPPEPKKGELYGPDELCWLCGGPTHGVGWPWKRAIKPTFTNHNNASCLTSQTICQPCVAMQSKETWEAYVAARPELGLKTGHALSWRSYSHAFSAAGHTCPMRTAWRDWVLDPPEPPFLFVIATSGQKHILFRATVANSRDSFPVQLEEETLWVNREDLAECVRAFERIYALGFSKDSILSGDYHPAQAMKVGVAELREADAAIRPWRERFEGYMRLAHFCAQRPEEDKG